MLLGRGFTSGTVSGLPGPLSRQDIGYWCDYLLLWWLLTLSRYSLLISGRSRFGSIVSVPEMSRFASDNSMSRSDAARPACFGRVVARSGSVRVRPVPESNGSVRSGRFGSVSYSFLLYTSADTAIAVITTTPVTTAIVVICQHCCYLLPPPSSHLQYREGAERTNNKAKPQQHTANYNKQQ